LRLRIPNYRLLLFAGCGAAGFVVDTSILWVLVRLVGINPYASRMVSYIAAVTTTWMLNRRFTFCSSGPRAREFMHFVTVNVVGALVNYLVFAAIVSTWGIGGFIPVEAVAAGSLAGLFLNYSLSRRFVFSQ